MEGFRADENMGNAAGFKSPDIIARGILAEIRKVPEKDADVLGRNLHLLAGLGIGDAPACCPALPDQPLHKSRNRIGRAFFNRLRAEILLPVGCGHRQRDYRRLPIDCGTPARQSQIILFHQRLERRIHEIEDRLDGIVWPQFCNGSCLTPAAARTAFTFW